MNVIDQVLQGSNREERIRCSSSHFTYNRTLGGYYFHRLICNNLRNITKVINLIGAITNCGWHMPTMKGTKAHLPGQWWACPPSTLRTKTKSNSRVVRPTWHNTLDVGLRTWTRWMWFGVLIVIMKNVTKWRVESSGDNGRCCGDGTSTRHFGWLSSAERSRYVYIINRHNMCNTEQQKAKQHDHKIHTIACNFWGFTFITHLVYRKYYKALHS